METPPEPPRASRTHRRRLLAPGLWAVLLSALAAAYVFVAVEPQWVEQKSPHPVFSNASGQLVYVDGGEERAVGQVVPYSRSVLRQSVLDELGEAQPALHEQWVLERISSENQTQLVYSLLRPKFHLGPWSLLPALVTIVLCLLTREPLPALFGGIAVGAVMLGKFDVVNQVLIPNLATTNAAGVLLLYLWLLGGLLGIWSKTGAASAFAELATAKLVRGPRSAKLVAWILGVSFFQGGSVSTVLVGTTVRPIADREQVSHEEMAYIVDSTASPIASLLAFNAWPAYIQAFLFVPGAAFLATESDRIAFFFKSIPLSFYSIFAVLGTLALCMDVTRHVGPGMRKALHRARMFGQLDGPGARPLAVAELAQARVPGYYQPHVLEFFAPLILIIGIAVASFVALGSPKIYWAFGVGLVYAVSSALWRGMALTHVVEGFSDGLKGVVAASVILMLAIAIGAISREVGGGLYLVDLLGQSMPFWVLPVALQVITMVTAFSTGTSWGTYAIAFPLALPLAWAVAQSQGVAHPELFMSVCFVAVLNGSVYGDQCSPISDTTILSAMTTGCDLMDHFKTQIIPATYAAIAAGACWTALTWFFC